MTCNLRHPVSLRHPVLLLSYWAFYFKQRAVVYVVSLLHTISSRVCIQSTQICLQRKCTHSFYFTHRAAVCVVSLLHTMSLHSVNRYVFNVNIRIHLCIMSSSSVCIQSQQVGEERVEGLFDLSPNSRQTPSVAVVTMSSSSVCIQALHTGCSCFDTKQQCMYSEYILLTFLNVSTGWRRPIGCLKLQVIFRKRATNYRALLREMTC